MKEKRSSATNSYKSWLSFKSHQTDASGHKSPEHANATVSPVKSMVFSTSSRFLDDDEYERPTVEEESILRRVSGKVPWVAYTIAFVELCERFSFFGTAAVCESSSPRVIQFWILTWASSRQLHPTASTRRFDNRCRWFWPTWCSEYGTTSRDWSYHLWVFSPIIAKVSSSGV